MSYIKISAQSETVGRFSSELKTRGKKANSYLKPLIATLHWKLIPITFKCKYKGLLDTDEDRKEVLVKRTEKYPKYIAK